MIVTADEFRIGIFRARYAANIRTDIHNVADIRIDWPVMIEWLNSWQNKRKDYAVELDLILLADRTIHDPIAAVVSSFLKSKDSRFLAIVKNVTTRLTLFDHDGDITFEWTNQLSSRCSTGTDL